MSSGIVTSLAEAAATAAIKPDAAGGGGGAWQDNILNLWDATEAASDSSILIDTSGNGQDTSNGGCLIKIAGATHHSTLKSLDLQGAGFISAPTGAATRGEMARAFAYRLNTSASSNWQSRTVNATQLGMYRPSDGSLYCYRGGDMTQVFPAATVDVTEFSLFHTFQILSVAGSVRIAIDGVEKFPSSTDYVGTEPTGQGRILGGNTARLTIVHIYDLDASQGSAWDDLTACAAQLQTDIVDTH
tara:strand:- start:4593 stop:5324 length:732 start_codon:yes stop_codon:yes gene_type:complete